MIAGNEERIHSDSSKAHHTQTQRITTQKRRTSRVASSQSKGVGKKSSSETNQVWKRKETPEASKAVEGGSSNSVGDSIHSSHRRTKLGSKEKSKQKGSAEGSRKNDPSVSARLGDTSPTQANQEARELS
ncbi:hypothetical protein F2Q68_00036111 [Brassica cretica]|uniref:Uncharacterized protein n=1 Tax=Brassica cretica TaxID=69181 RepID=A0A8S9GY50_BRACR|nr:hypothetical protein F2Q68_00036111 [Brassica cretica]